MSWLGLTDHHDGRFAPSGLGKFRHRRTGSAQMERGTFMFETRVPGQVRPHDLVGYSKTCPWPRELMFRAIPGGGIAMVHRHNTDVTHAALQWAGDGRAHSLRVTYAWDNSQGWARLALEQPAGGALRYEIAPAQHPKCTGDLRDFMLGGDGRILSNDVVFCAASNTVSPIGPMPTLHLSTPIATPTGYQTAGRLQRGDMVLTETGVRVPVLHTARLTVPARGSFAPVRLRAPYFGLTRDIIVAPEQRLVLRGSEVEYNFGQEAVLVPARHVINGNAAIWAPPSALVTYVQVVLPGHEALLAAGCALESMYIGRIRRDRPRLEMSVLADAPRQSLPEHARPFHQVLRPFEAITLLDQRAA
ncbi:MAG: Hint domain-containing protein [Pseudomonadota bacterium]